MAGRLHSTPTALRGRRSRPRWIRRSDLLLRPAQQFCVKFGADPFIKVCSSSDSGNGMRFPGKKQHFKLLSRIDKRLRELHGVLDVDVVIAGAVHEQQMSAEI